MPNRKRRLDKTHPAHEIPLEDANGFHMTHIVMREARQGVADGVYRGSYAPYRMGTPVEQRELLKVQLTSTRVPTLKVRPPITRGEADAAVGLHGESHTLGRSEFQKQLRVLRIRRKHNRVVREEDHIELAIAKLAFLPVVTDDRNPATVGPRVDHAALARFVELP